MIDRVLRLCDLQEGRLTRIVDGTVRVHDFDEDQQWVRWAEINQHDVGQALVRRNRQTDRLGQFVIARHYLIAALAQGNGPRLLQELRGENLDHCLRNVGTRPCRHPPGFAVGKRHQLIQAQATAAI